MSHQLIFAGSEFNSKRRRTRKEIFLSRMDELMPWDQLETVIEPFYPKLGKGSRLYLLSIMFRIHCMQHWYNERPHHGRRALWNHLHGFVCWIAVGQCLFKTGKLTTLPS